MFTYFLWEKNGWSALVHPMTKAMSSLQETEEARKTLPMQQTSERHEPKETAVQAMQTVCNIV